MYCYIFHNIHFGSKFQAFYNAEKLLIITKPSTLLYEQKYVGMVNFNFRVFYFILKW